MRRPDFFVKTALVFHVTLTSSRELICLKQVPVQKNSYDCGLHTLHMSQRFLEDPDRFCQIILVGSLSYSQNDFELTDLVGPKTKRVPQTELEKLADWGGTGEDMVRLRQYLGTMLDKLVAQKNA
jgi:hypothetical protein